MDLADRGARSAPLSASIYAYIYSISIFNNNLTKIKVNKKVYTCLETKIKNECAWPILPHGLGPDESLNKKIYNILFLRSRCYV